MKAMKEAAHPAICRYTFVWGNAIKTNKEKMVKQIDELWQYAQNIAGEEMKDTEPLDFKNIDADKVKQTVAAIEAPSKTKIVSNKVTQKLFKAITRSVFIS